MEGRTVGAFGFGGQPGMAVVAALPGLLDQAGVAMATLDGDGGLAMLSPSMAKVLGRPAAQIPAAALAETLQLHTEDGRRLLATEELALVRAGAGETVRDELITTKRPDGALRYLRCNAAPLPAPAGHHRGAILVVDDVTEATDGSATYADLRRRLIDWFNHQLRTPLSILRGHTELLDDPDLDLPQRAADSLAAMQRATQRLTGLADTITAMGDASEAGSPARAADDASDGVNARVVSLPRADDPTGATYRISTYTVYPTGFAEVAHDDRRRWLLRVEDAGDGWAVRWRSRCLNYRREWEFEPPPKSRTDDFLRRCRFSERAALLRAQQAADELVVDAMTFEDFIAKVRADAAARARAALENGGTAPPGDADAARPVLPLQYRLRRGMPRRGDSSSPR